MTNNRIGLLTIIGLLLAACAGFGSLIFPQSPLDLGQSAGLIVVGTSAGVTQTGSDVAFTIHVSRVIKGDPVLAGNDIGAYLDRADLNPGWTRSGGALPETSGNGIWFLKGASNSWRLLPVVQGAFGLTMAFFPAPSGPVLDAYAYGAAASLSDKLTSEVCSAIEGLGGNYNFQLYALQDGALDKMKSPVAETFYRRMSASNSSRQRILGLSGLIRGGNAAALTSAAQAASAPEEFLVEYGILLLSVRDFFRSSDPNSIEAAGKAALDSSNPSLPFREAAAHALAAVHTPATLPYLATLLDDPDATLRAEAIGGMGAFTNGLKLQTSSGVPGLAHMQLPAGGPYKTPDTIANFASGVATIAKNEASYLSFWKTWWSQNRTSLGY